MGGKFKEESKMISTLKKKLSKKGFTLAELLVVVAIIAVLVAISIPVFTSQLEKSREAVDLANIRAAYAECAAAVLTDDTHDYGQSVTIEQKEDGWKIDASDVAGLNVGNDALGKLLGKTNSTVVVKVDKTGAFSLVSATTGLYNPATGAAYS